MHFIHNSFTIDRMLSNEKYAGDVLMQKTYTPDYLTGKKEKNQGQLEKYLVENERDPVFELFYRKRGHIFLKTVAGVGE